jgi:hypothetical protein
VVAVDPQGELLQVVRAIHPSRCFADFLDGGQEQAGEQDEDDQNEGGLDP